MNKKRLFIALAVLLVAVIAIAIIAPMLRVDRIYGWVEDAHGFLYDVDKSLQKYLLTHEGKMPPTMASLYPENIDDKRVLEQTPLFEGHRMAIIYWYPQSLGDANVPVVQLVLDPSVKTPYPWNSFVLWGDGKVRLGQKRQRNEQDDP
jgi:hypothetical protein